MKSMAGRRSRATEKRREAIIDAAYELFVAKGYGSVSIDDIIKIAGGSKSTLYKIFGSKEGIMKEVIASLASEMLRQIRVDYPPDKTVREVLTGIGEVLVDLALSDMAINQFRLAVANSGPFPDVALLWYESGPRTTMDGIAELLARENARGRLRIDDPMRASWFFAGMLIFRENMVRLVGAPAAERAEMTKTVEHAVEAFLKIYAP
jgi:TetR/AcrR family transcriptional regulator, mexJK operon transcriptional repressor